MLFCAVSLIFLTSFLYLCDSIQYDYKSLSLELSRATSVAVLLATCKREFAVEGPLVFTGNDGVLPYIDPSAKLGLSPFNKETTLYMKIAAEATEIDYPDDIPENLKLKLRTGGLCGLTNLGNTCFMNSALQCLIHMRFLVTFFLSSSFQRELNYENPIGSGGKLALAFAVLMQGCWSSSGHKAITPSQFKASLARFAPFFSGFGQQDSQEVMAFMLDGLHEDLNRVSKKPYVLTESVTNPTADLHSCSEVSWNAYLHRDQSLIVDIFHGQMMSTMHCSVCQTTSRVFDPFMYLPLSLRRPDAALTSSGLAAESSTLRSSPFLMKFMLVPYRYVGRPKIHPVTFEGADCQIDEVLEACAEVLGTSKDEAAMVLVHEQNKKLICGAQDLTVEDVMRLDRSFDAPDASASDEKPFPAYCCKHLMIVVYEYAQSDVEPPFSHSDLYSFSRNVSLDDMQKEEALRFIVGLEVLFVGPDETNVSATHPSLFLMRCERDESYVDACHVTGDSILSAILQRTNLRQKRQPEVQLSLHVYQNDTWVQLEMEDRVELKERRTGEPYRLQLRAEIRLASAADNPQEKETKTQEMYSNLLLEFSPEKGLNKLITKSSLAFHRVPSQSVLPPTQVTLEECLESFMQPTVLEDKNKWYCPKCKDHVLAKKKFDMFRYPPVLIFQLKRFGARMSRLSTSVTFPVSGLDMSSYLHEEAKADEHECIYDLVAVSDHYGSMSFGHYVAHVQHPFLKSWYLFNDSSVSPCDERDISPDSAYILFYQRRGINAVPRQEPSMSLEEVQKHMKERVAAVEEEQGGSR